MGARHRLGIVGNAALPGNLIETASAYGLSIRKSARVRDVFSSAAAGRRWEILKQAAGFGQAYTFKTSVPSRTAFAQELAVDKLLPPEFTGRTHHDIAAVRKALAFLEKPLATASRAYESRNLADSLQAVTDADTLFDAISQRFTFDQVERAQKIAFGRVSDEEAETRRQSLHAAVRFMTSGSVQPAQKEDEEGHAHHNHHDGCEHVADDMLEQAAILTGNEVFSDLLPGLRYSEEKGLFKLSLAHDFAHGEAAAPKAQALTAALWDNLHKATRGRYKGKHIHAVHLTGAELSSFARGFFGTLETDPALTDDVLQEEQHLATEARIADYHRKIEGSESFKALQALKPEQVLNARLRLQALSGAAGIMAGLVDNEQMRRIWSKFRVTQRHNAKGIEEFSENLQALQTTLNARLQNDDLTLAEAEAVVTEFRDTIAASRYFIAVLQASLAKAGPFIADIDTQRRNLAMLDEMLKSSSLSPVKLAAEHIEHDLWSVSHYLARHTGTEGVHFGRAFQEFVNDFGGEVMEFVQKNPGLTAVSVGLLYLMLSNNGGGNQVSMIAPEYAGANAGLDEFGLPIATAGAAPSVPTVKCHLHMPDILSMAEKVLPESMKVPNIESLPEELQRYYRHCISLDAAMAQLHNGYAILKGPLGMVLHAPDQAGEALAALRPAGAPPFAFAESFNQSVKFFGDFYFVANGYQNLAHAPWFGVAAAMGWRLGVVQSLVKTSALINPLIDAVIAMGRNNPMAVAVVIAAAAYGYAQPAAAAVDGAMVQQGVSGAIAGSVLGGFAGWGLQGITNLMRKIPELEFLKENNIAQGITPAQRRVTKAQDLIAAGCPEGLAPMIEQILQKTFAPDAAPAAAGRIQDKDVWLAIGGETVRTAITQDNIRPLVTALEELNFSLETAPEKIGFDEEDHETYIAALQKAVRQSVQVLKDSAGWENYGLEERLHLTHSLRGALDLVIGAELRHLGDSAIYKALTGGDLSRRQHKQLRLEAGRTRRMSAFAHNTQEDAAKILQLCRSMGRNLKDISQRPLKMPLNAAYKTTVMAKTLLKMGLRQSWYVTLQGLSLGAQQVNKLEPKTKGNLIGAGLTAAAVASGIDFSAALPDSPAQDAARQISSAAGHVAGATTATGLFAVYNFAEDHILIHVGLGAFFIVSAGGVKMVTRPVQKVSRALLTPLADSLEDMRLPVRAPVRLLGAAGRFLKSYADDVIHYDERYHGSCAPC